MNETAAGTAVALATTLHDQKIEATNVAETAVSKTNLLATAEADTHLLAQQDLAYQLALESTHNLNNRPHFIQQSALLALEAVHRYPDDRTVQSLQESLKLLPDYDK